jgi:DNA invertase Pin-like site-specific DNA recombinase
LDRLARSVADLLGIVARLEKKKVALRVLAMSGSQPLDTGTPIGKLMLAVIGAVGQFEREMMLERQREGIVKAKGQAATRAVCRPLGGRLPRSSGSRPKVSGPLIMP